MVTCPTTVPSRPCPTPSYQASVDAFRQLGIRRIVSPDQQCSDSIMMELTFNNTAPTSVPVRSSDITTSMAKSWLHLRAVRAAFLRRELLSDAAMQDLDLILNRLPPAWQDTITSHASTPLPGFVASGAIWPSLWPLDNSPTAPPPASAPPAHLGLLGLGELEERWRRVAASRLATQPSPAATPNGEKKRSDDAPPPLNTPPSWLDLTPRPPRLSPAQRRAIRGNLPAPDLRRNFPNVWRPLLDGSLHPP